MPPSPSAVQPAAHGVRGILLYCVSMLTFAALDTAAKYAGRYLPPVEVVWVRFAVHLALALLILQPWRDFRPYRTRRPWLQGLRSLFLVSSTLFNFLALRHLQLDQTISIGFASPFLIAALAGPLLGEWAGPHRWVAIGIGFLGVLVITGAGSRGFDPAMLLSVCAATSYSLYILLTRLLASSESSAGMLLYSAMLPALLLTPVALPIAEPPPGLVVALCLLLTGICGMFGHWCVIIAHRMTPAPVLAPFMYTQIIWALLLGMVVFGDRPAANTLAGAGIIVASGVYLVRHEAVHAESEHP